MGPLSLEIALVAYAAVVVSIFSIARWKYQITTWSSAALAAVFGLIILSAIFPISSLYQMRKKHGLVGLYLIIIAITIIIVLVYIADKASHDRVRDCGKKSTAYYDFAPVSNSDFAKYYLL